MRRRTLLVFLSALALLLGGSHLMAKQENSSERISLEDFKTLLASDKPVLVIDVRHEISSKIKGAKHIPLDQLEARLSEIPRDAEIVTYCA